MAHHSGVPNPAPVEGRTLLRSCARPKSCRAPRRRGQARHPAPPIVPPQTSRQASWVVRISWPAAVHPCQHPGEWHAFIQPCGESRILQALIDSNKQPSQTPQSMVRSARRLQAGASPRARTATLMRQLASTRMLGLFKSCAALAPVSSIPA